MSVVRVLIGGFCGFSPQDAIPSAVLFAAWSAAVHNKKASIHFEEVRGGVEPWLMARWKARVEFLFSVIELFLSLTVEALQGIICQNSLPSGAGGSV